LEDNIDPTQTEHSPSSRMALAIVGVIRAVRGDVTTGEAMVRQSVTASQTVGDTWGAAFGRYALGRVLLIGGRAVEAIPVLEASVEGVGRIGENVLSGLALIVLGWVYLEVGDIARAERSLLASLEVMRGFGNRDGVARSLEALAALAIASGDAHLGARLFGAASESRASVGVTVWVPDYRSHDQTERRLVQILGADVFAQLMREGASLAVDLVPDLLVGRDTHSTTARLNKSGGVIDAEVRQSPAAAGASAFQVKRLASMLSYILRCADHILSTTARAAAESEPASAARS
jgi:hypothetical protein